MRRAGETLCDLGGLGGKHRLGKTRWQVLQPPWWTVLPVALAACVLVACSGGDGPEVMDNSGEEWQVRGQTCIRESEEGPVRRVINRVDPELCGRNIGTRSRDYVRVVPPPGMRSR